MRHFRNLDATEQRCEKLTALLKSLNPDIDIEQALKNGVPSAPPKPPSTASPRSPQQVDEASPGSSHEYEWHEAPLSNDKEQVQSLRDGMALLSTDPSESGYIGTCHPITLFDRMTHLITGSSAGSSMLQTIFSLLSLKGPLDDPSRKELSNFIATRQRSESGALLLEGDLASSLITEGLIDAYFLLYNTSYPILHSQLFRESYKNRSQISTTSTWQLIFYTVLAIGHWVLSSGEDHADSPYYLAARSRMSAGMLESGTLAGVQAFLLMVSLISSIAPYPVVDLTFRATIFKNETVQTQDTI
jgi:transcriptional regulatory protein GAL4